MNRIAALLQSSIGRKLVMAATGVLLLAFLIVHLLGNLYVFQGREPLNSYAAWLKDNPLIWPARARIGLLGLFGLHIWVGISLARENRAARPVGYRRGLAHPSSTWTSRSMAVTGTLVLAFLVFHLAHFTWGWILPDAHALRDTEGRHDVYGMVLAGLRTPWIAAIYLFSMAILAVHLSHAGQSFLQTLGIRYEHGNRIVRGLGYGLVLIVIVGNLLLPTLVFIGVGSGSDGVDAVARAALETSP
ncbi:MAG: succinate dehydrogenase cytochrome b subunit [Gammaproteobacteria bacterium]|nr:succinate dehydrogenase cytochrome b subunit [Gammaproteobacteria bacterium]